MNTMMNGESDISIGSSDICTATALLDNIDIRNNREDRRDMEYEFTNDDNNVEVASLNTDISENASSREDDGASSEIDDSDDASRFRAAPTNDSSSVDIYRAASRRLVPDLSRTPPPTYEESQAAHLKILSNRINSAIVSPMYNDVGVNRHTHES